MFKRLSRMASAVMMLSALAVFAWAEGRTPKKDGCCEKNGCCADACAKETCDGDDSSPACTDACPGTDPCEASTTTECGTGCAAAKKCVSSGCCKKAGACAGCCKSTTPVSEGCCSGCKTTAVKAADGCCACCKTVATKVSEACCACCKGACACSKKTVSTGGACAGGKACCTAATPVSACCACCKATTVAVTEGCCACCKGECSCAKKEAAACCEGKACCTAAAKTAGCGACCKTTAVAVSEGCCACCKGECSCAKKEAAACCAGKGCCTAAAKTTGCCACCKATTVAVTEGCCACCKAAAVTVSEGCCACCKGECPCSKKVGKTTSRSPVVPVFAPMMLVPHVPAAPPVPYFQAPMVAPAPCAPPAAGAFDHSTYNMPVPCPGMPMPCPNVGYTSQSSCAMPQPVALALTPASAPKQYEVCVKLIDCKPGRDDRVATMPRLTVVEGEPGRCTIGSDGCAGSLRVRIDRTASDKVSVGVRLSKRNTCYESEGSVVTCQSCSTVRTVKLDEAVRVALCKSCEEAVCGKTGKWLEIQVKECESKCEATASVTPPQVQYTSQPMPWTRVYPGTAPACAAPAAPPVLACPPASCMANAPPELVRCSATEPKSESRERVVNVASDGCLQVLSDDCTVRGTTVSLQVKDTTLTLRSEEMKGRKRVCVEADCDLEAVADKMTVAADGRLILEGEVHILCASPSSGMAERVEAGRVVLEVEGGKIKCIQVVHDKP